MNAIKEQPVFKSIDQVAALARVSLSEFRTSRNNDLLEKCQRFHAYADALRQLGLYQVQYRIPLTSALDRRIRVVDPLSGREREMVCFDSNSYLGLHLHPRVVAAVHRALDDVGYGTPSAQVLGGTNRYLLELEETIASVHGREQALIFPSGYQANVGILTGLLRENDLVLCDAYSHASIQDGCHYAGCQVVRYPHKDMDELERRLAQHIGSAQGALIVTDGLFSMHGDLAPLPCLREIADRSGARLMIDDAHSLGIIGPTGEGLEEHFGMPGSVDVLMGTFSKAPGAMGGYVCGDASLIEYLRFFSHGALFTAALPACTCAGLTEAIRIMREEPEHRERLWENARYPEVPLHTTQTDPVISLG